MRILSFGQPTNSIVQIAYIVPDIRTAISTHVQTTGIGPWLLMEHFRPKSQKYRGNPTDLDVSIATAYSGSMMFELIQQNDDSPSVFQEVRDQSGYGHHHIALASDNFDADNEKYLALGYDPVFEAVTPDSLGEARITYFDTRRDLPFMVELIEMNQQVENLFSHIRQMSRDWDGKDPIRLPG